MCPLPQRQPSAIMETDDFPSLDRMILRCSSYCLLDFPGSWTQLMRLILFSPLLVSLSPCSPFCFEITFQIDHEHPSLRVCFWGNSRHPCSKHSKVIGYIIVSNCATSFHPPCLCKCCLLCQNMCWICCDPSNIHLTPSLPPSTLSSPASSVQNW